MSDEAYWKDRIRDASRGRAAGNPPDACSPCHRCNDKRTVTTYFDAGDHFSAGTAPDSGWRTYPCPECTANTANIGQIPHVQISNSPAVRNLMKTEPKTRIERIASDLCNCAEAWEADACLLGNVTAEEIRDLCQWVLNGSNTAPENR